MKTYILYPKTNTYEELENLIDPWESLEDLIKEFEQFNVDYIVVKG